MEEQKAYAKICLDIAIEQRNVALNDFLVTKAQLSLLQAKYTALETELKKINDGPARKITKKKPTKKKIVRKSKR